MEVLEGQKIVAGQYILSRETPSIVDAHRKWGIMYVAGIILNMLKIFYHMSTSVFSVEREQNVPSTSLHRSRACCMPRNLNYASILCVQHLLGLRVIATWKMQIHTFNNGKS